MSFLQQARQGAADRAKIVMVYGVPGIGKSTVAAQMPNCVFVPTEDNVDHITTATVLPLAKDYAMFKNMLVEIANEDHPFENLVIDSISSLDKIINKAVEIDNNVDQIEKIPYGKGKEFAQKYWDDFWSVISYIRDNRNMNVILIAHPEIKKVPNPEGEAYDGYKPMLNEKAMEKLKQNCNAVFFANYKVMVRSVDAGFGNKEHKGVGNGSAVMYTQARPAHVAKSACNPPLPYEMPFDLATAIDMMRYPSKYAS